MSLWQSYKRLSTRTRLLAGGGLIAYALAGQYLSDQAEQAFGYTPTPKEKEDLEAAMPRIRVFDRDEEGEKK